MRVTVWLFGREVLCLETGHPDDRPALEAGPGGSFEFGFCSPSAPDDDEQVRVTARPRTKE